jgi:hypothetical protein
MKRILLLASLLAAAPALADNTTDVGRIPLAHPNLGHVGGAPLHAHMNDIFTALSNDVSTRYVEYTGKANSSVTSFAHNLGEPFADLTVVLYSGVGITKTRVANPSGSGWTIAATGGTSTVSVDVTAPSSGGPHSFSLEIYGSLKGMSVQSPAAVAITGGTITGTNIDLTGTTITGIVPPQNGGTGVANNSAATLTRSGNHALTVTTTGTTGVTLPTTGT